MSYLAVLVLHKTRGMYTGSFRVARGVFDLTTESHVRS